KQTNQHTNNKKTKPATPITNFDLLKADNADSTVISARGIEAFDFDQTPVNMRLTAPSSLDSILVNARLVLLLAPTSSNRTPRKVQEAPLRKLCARKTNSTL